jgi:hypothetical protein
MLKVLPIQSKEQQKEICEKCQISYQPDLLAYAASVDDELVGICQFKMTDQGGFLYDLAKVIDHTENKECSDFEAMFVMGRGTLNFIDLCGVHRAFFCGKNPDDSLLRAIGFKKNDTDQYEINLEGFFTDHCGNHK